MDDNAKKTKDNKEEVKKQESRKNTETEELKGKISDLEAQVKRTLADYQNLEKRTEEREKNMISRANKWLLLRILPVLDTLMMAGKHNQSAEIGICIKQFLDILTNEGVEKIDTKGKKFDPNIMEAVEAVDGKEGEVIEEVKPGYTLNDQVLRPALVKVGKNN